MTNITIPIIPPKNIEFPYHRDEIISMLLNYSWEDYQIYVIINRGSYTSYIINNAHSIDDFYMNDDYREDEAEPPYNIIGEIYRTQREAELMFKFCRLHDQLIFDVHGDLFMREYWIEEDHLYFNSPFWAKMVEAAQEAFAEFMKNEEYDEEYTAYMEDGKIRMQSSIDKRKAELARTGKKPY